MNAENNGGKRVSQDRLDEYEVSAIYDDAGTPPRDEWLRRRGQRRERLVRFDLWLREFRREHP